MKWFQVAVVIGALLIVAGVYFIYPSRSTQQIATYSIHAGKYLYLSFNVFRYGYVSGSYSETTGQSLTLYVFDNNQYVSFTTQSNTQGLFSTTGSAGVFSASLPMPGTYYLVLLHGPGNDQITQTVSVTIDLGGTNLLILGAGFGIIASGVIIAFLGNRAKKKIEAPTSSGVILFDQQRPPEQSQVTSSGVRFSDGLSSGE